MKQLSIIFSSDNNYAQHLGVAICSLFENNNAKKITIYVIDGGINDENLKKLSAIEDRYNFKINYLHANKDVFKKAYLSNYLTEAAYYRISIGELLPDNIDRVLYLDCDVIIKGNIESIFLQTFDNHIVLAGNDPGIYEYKHLSIKSRRDYFNSGVMYIDLKKWRNEKIGQKCIEFINKNPEKIILHDQDVLNAALINKWKRLHPKYNVLSDFYDHRGADIFTKTEILEATQNPVILHFNTFKKPWDFLCHHPMKSEYRKYLSFTPWANYKASMPSMIGFAKYYYYRYIPIKTRIGIRKYILEPTGIRKRSTSKPL